MAEIEEKGLQDDIPEGSSWIDKDQVRLLKTIQSFLDETPETADDQMRTPKKEKEKD